MFWRKSNKIQDYVRKYKKNLTTNLTIPIIEERLPEGHEPVACMDPQFDRDGNINGIIVRSTTNAPLEHYLHELVHVRLFYIENFRTLGHPSNFQDEDKIKQEGIIFAEIVDDRIVHQMIYKRGFNPIHENFFSDIKQVNEYLINKNYSIAMDKYNHMESETYNLYKASRFLLARSGVGLFPKILNKEKRVLLETFIELFHSSFPEAHRIATNIEAIFKKYNILHKNGHTEILKEIRDFMSINKSEIYLCEYKKINSLFRLERIE